MIGTSHLRAFLTHEPWNDRYELRISSVAGRYTHAAVRVESGRIVYEETDEGATVDPVLVLCEAEIVALSNALFADLKPENATLDALKDARSVRDRLLSMLEARGIR